MYKASSKNEAASPAQPEVKPSHTYPETSKVKREIVSGKPLTDNSFDTIMARSLAYVYGQQAAQRTAPFPVIIPGRLSEEEYHSLASKFEHKNEKEVKLLVGLLKEKREGERSGMVTLQSIQEYLSVKVISSPSMGEMMTRPEVKLRASSILSASRF